MRAGYIAMARFKAPPLDRAGSGGAHTSASAVSASQEADGPAADEDLMDFGAVNTRIVGVKYYKGSIGVGEVAHLRRDPHNKYDKNCVEVYVRPPAVLICTRACQHISLMFATQALRSRDTAVQPLACAVTTSATASLGPSLPRTGWRRCCPPSSATTRRSRSRLSASAAPPTGTGTSGTGKRGE